MRTLLPALALGTIPLSAWANDPGPAGDARPGANAPAPTPVPDEAAQRAARSGLAELQVERCFRNGGPGQIELTVRIAATGRVQAATPVPGSDRRTAACLVRAVRRKRFARSPAVVEITHEFVAARVLLRSVATIGAIESGGIQAVLSGEAGIGSTTNIVGNGQGSAPSRPSRVTMGTPVVRGGLAEDVVAHVLRRHVNALRRCHEGALRRRPDLEGEIRLDLGISAEGRVTSTSVREGGLDDAELRTCVAETARRWRLPAPEDGETFRVDAPIRFSVVRPAP